MIFYVIVGAFAAFGVFCGVWMAFGGLLPGKSGGAAVCLCREGLREEPILRRYLWLRGLGLIRVPLLAVDCGLREAERKWIEDKGGGIELCCPEELPARLELERNRLE